MNPPVWKTLRHTNEDEQPYWLPREFAALNLLQGQPRLALDVGCSAGYAGEQLKARFPTCQVWGAESNRRAADLAETRMDRVLREPFEAIDWAAELAGRRFDAVLLLDVLEHMYDPWRVLESLRGCVSDSAEIIISLPNVRNYNLMHDIANGYWRYTRSGLLDITHIRFFTEYEALKMFYQTGFRRTHWYSTVDDNWQRWQHVQHFPFTISDPRWTITVDNQADLLQLATVCNVTRLVPASAESLADWERELASDGHPATRATV